MIVGFVDLFFASG